MKNLLLLCILLLVPFISNAQFQKGTKFVNGVFTYDSYKYLESEPASNFLIFGAGIGFFVNRSFALGPVLETSRRVLYNINPVTNQYEKNRSASILGGIFVRKFFPISEKFLFSLEGRTLVGRNVREISVMGSKPESNTLRIQARPVFTFLPNSKWAFEAGVGNILYEKNSPHQPFLDTDVFRASLGEVNFGISYFFRKMEKWEAKK